MPLASGRSYRDRVTSGRLAYAADAAMPTAKTSTAAAPTAAGSGTARAKVTAARAGQASIEQVSGPGRTPRRSRAAAQAFPGMLAAAAAAVAAPRWIR